jgi:DNA polymerase III epsilon subunit-like protein
LTWDKNQNEKEMLKKFIEVMNEAHEIIGHNSDKFDERELRTRCIANGVLMHPTYRTLDTLKKSRKHFSFASNKLDYIGQFLNCGKKLPHEGYNLWIKIVENNDRNALKDMVAYCERDVTLLEDAYKVLSPYITHNTNFSTFNDNENRWGCPECTSTNIMLEGTDITPSGIIKRKMSCKECNKHYTISNRNYQKMLERINQL